MDRWNERIVVEGITKFLTEKQYPENLSNDEKRNYRKRAQDFIVIQGKLHHKCKKSGQTRNAISSESTAAISAVVSSPPVPGTSSRAEPVSSPTRELGRPTPTSTLQAPAQATLVPSPPELSSQVSTFQASSTSSSARSFHRRRLFRTVQQEGIYIIIARNSYIVIRYRGTRSLGGTISLAGLLWR